MKNYGSVEQVYNDHGYNDDGYNEYFEINDFFCNFCVNWEQKSSTLLRAAKIYFITTESSTLRANQIICSIIQIITLSRPPPQECHVFFNILLCGCNQIGWE